MIVLTNVAVAFEHELPFGNNQWVHWYVERDGTWTAHCYQKGKVSYGHKCPVQVGKEYTTHSISGTIVSIAPRYKGEGVWEWSTHLESDVPPLSDTLGESS